MKQFEAITLNGGDRYLTLIDTTRYDFFIGFHRVLRRLP